MDRLIWAERTGLRLGLKVNGWRRRSICKKIANAPCKPAIEFWLGRLAEAQKKADEYRRRLKELEVSHA